MTPKKYLLMKNSMLTINYPLQIIKLLIAIAVPLLLSVNIAEAASISLNPSTGVHQSGSTFTVRVEVSPQGQSINAADGTLSFNPSQLSVVSVNRTSSIFNLWVSEPTFSNSAGTVNFSGGLPSGYSGSRGTIMTVTFRALGSGPSRVNFSNGSVLANDGRGTNILTSMNGGNYTIQSAVAAPEPEVIEYIATANTPSAPQITSVSHPDSDGWFNTNEAKLSWSLPSDVTQVRTLLNDNPTSVPTRIYETPIREITIPDLDEGVSYFHLQFRNAEGWGRVTHYRLGVDTTPPTDIELSLPEDADASNPTQTLEVTVEDATSEVNRYQVIVNNGTPFEYVDETSSGTIVLPPLEPGGHSVIVTAFDEAGNGITETFTFTIVAFEKPLFTEVPSEISNEVIPVIQGTTKPNSTVEILLTRIGSEPSRYEVISDSEGRFTFIPEGQFDLGVYELTAQATDENGARSEPSDAVRIAVQQPGYLQIGSFLVSVLSVVVPLILLVLFLILGLWYVLLVRRRFRKTVRVESREALEILKTEFSNLQTVLRSSEHNMKESRKSKKLTNAESEMIEAMDRALQASQKRVEKEVEDVRRLVKKDKS
jgi:hypothetical protein